MQEFLNEKVMPALGKLSQVTVIKAIQYGCMATMPLTLGVVLISIAANFPITAWTDWLAATGLSTHATAVVQVTMSISGLYMAFFIGYYNTSERRHNGLTGGAISLGTFLALMPQEIAYEGGTVSGLSFDYLGSNGIFGGMIIAICVTGVYCWLDGKNLKIKLPDSVPPKVTESLEPTFISIIIFTCVFLIRVAFSYTPYGNFYDAVNTIVGTPITGLGSSPVAATIYMVFVSLFWFFGIHPNTLVAIYMPVFVATGQANLSAYLAGEALPYLSFSGTLAYYAIGGSGNTLGLALIMPFVCKSERYKALSKLSIGPALFNINEPLIFGLPMMLNFTFLPPMVLSAVANGILGYFFYTLGVFNTLNPTISMPWTTPAFITPFFTIGLVGVLCACVAVVMDALIYLPFLKVADNAALAEEQENREALDAAA